MKPSSSLYYGLSWKVLKLKSSQECCSSICHSLSESNAPETFLDQFDFSSPESQLPKSFLIKTSILLCVIASPYSCLLFFVAKNVVLIRSIPFFIQLQNSVHSKPYIFNFLYIPFKPLQILYSFSETCLLFHNTDCLVPNCNIHFFAIMLLCISKNNNNNNKKICLNRKCCM